MTKSLDIIGLPNHVVDKNGNIYGLERTVKGRYDCKRKIKKSKVATYVGSNGYVHFTIRHENKCKGGSLHRVLALCFIPNPNKFKQVNHKDGNKLNNSLENLEWCTSFSNVRHAYDNGLAKKKVGDACKTRKLDSVKAAEILNLYHSRQQSIIDIAKQYGVSPSTISDIAKGKTWCNKKITVKELEEYVMSYKIETTSELIKRLKQDYGTSIHD